MDDSVELGHFCERVLDLARREFPDLKVSAFGTVPIFPRVDYYVRTGKVANVFTSQLGVALISAGLIAWRNRRRRGARLSPLRAGVVMSVPLFCATTVIGLVMWGLGTPLDTATAAIGALAINAALDFSIYLAMVYQQTLRTCSPTQALHKALGQEGKIIVADCLLNILCFAPLLASRFLPIQHIGWMMAMMLVTCAAASLIVMGALLPRCVVGQEAAV
jgi:predicted RND superfamily exporter protein